MAKHGSGGNNDEDAISYALESQNHDIVRLQENQGHKALGYNVDMLLFHKWQYSLAAPVLEKIKCPKVFWYFDLVDFDDPTLHGRCEMRKRWMKRITPLVDLGFCTDGDWVAQDKHGKLVQLSQGADDRMLGFGNKSMADKYPPILFTGTRNGGQGRSSFVDEMKTRYKHRFNHVSMYVHGRRLADLIASSKIVVAPDAPVTNNYWSNRVYLTLGFGGFLLHPRCRKLEQQYTHKEEIVYYRDRTQLHKMIECYLEDGAARHRIQSRGYFRTKRENTYRSRCAILIRKIHDYLGKGYV